MRWKLPVGRWSIFFFLFFLCFSRFWYSCGQKKRADLWCESRFFCLHHRVDLQLNNCSRLFFFLFFFPSKFFIYRIQHRKEFKSRQTLNEVTRRRIYFSRGKRINASSRVKNFQRQFTALLRFDSSKMYSNCRWVFIIHSCLS